MSPFVGESRIRKSIEKVNPWLPRAGEEGEGTGAGSYWISCWGDDNVLKSTVVTVGFL